MYITPESLLRAVEYHKVRRLYLSYTVEDEIEVFRGFIPLLRAPNRRHFLTAVWPYKREVDWRKASREEQQMIAEIYESALDYELGLDPADFEPTDLYLPANSLEAITGNEVPVWDTVLAKVFY